uniref:Uncharacterized protein n=1 Tax=Pyramimonas obovata TaxID=1411642 RepID=A0A6T7XE67_9CHLO|mmetsp:Transcript_34845/g.76163  ORF Transcript_34845/g.76163 Transcript_34845/m.76163 type:complete len:435 (+) Transcript_34845:107-1411(+)|eukprot:CAMPEP_0118925838 /NCGR_PEP_ID=MMETSP1169-20130426/3659_1 /TAXON_ID=36882 /ORGANISM="Pyramimonas obovata, Strain CCMP722" /LENGTH=434 /DNA_ID=CAMNT_0006867251 /DNA_START=105 /DNA_END=1409 /DNA_ORIENTATION=-
MSGECYVCKEKGDSSNKLVKCVGLKYCAEIHSGVIRTQSEIGEVTTSLKHIVTSEGKNERKELSNCDFVTGRKFHPACLERDSAGASFNRTFSCKSVDGKEQYTTVDQTHKLCQDCLEKWENEHGKVVNVLAEKGRVVTEADKKRREVNKSCSNRKREVSSIGRHAALGNDIKLVLTTTVSGQMLKPVQCSNLDNLSKMANTPPLNPAKEKFTALLNTVTTSWSELSKLVKDCYLQPSKPVNGDTAGGPSAEEPIGGSTTLESEGVAPCRTPGNLQPSEGYISVEEGFRALNARRSQSQDLVVGANLLLFEGENGDTLYYPCNVVAAEVQGKVRVKYFEGHAPPTGTEYELDYQDFILDEKYTVFENMGPCANHLRNGGMQNSTSNKTRAGIGGSTSDCSNACGTFFPTSGNVLHPKLTKAPSAILHKAPLLPR